MNVHESFPQTAKVQSLHSTASPMSTFAKVDFPGNEQRGILSIDTRYVVGNK